MVGFFHRFLTSQFSNKKQGSSRRLSAAAADVVRGMALEMLEGRQLLSSVLTYHNDLASTGVNSTETLLTPATISPPRW